LRVFLLVVLLLAGFNSAGTAQKTDGTPPGNNSQAVTNPENDPNADILAGATPAGDQAQAKWEAGNAKLTAAQEEYAAFTLQHAEAVYRWQHFSTQIIFCVVVLLMLAGIVFSWIQFRQGLHHPAQVIALSSSKVTTSGDAAPAADVTVEKAGVTEFSASPQGIKVASSTLGVIILVISMCFFYMYLRYVYPISVENADRAVTEVQKATGKIKR
jgi:hypothetical protein